jgi:hypothetical protein
LIVTLDPPRKVLGAAIVIAFVFLALNDVNKIRHGKVPRLELRPVNKKAHLRKEMGFNVRGGDDEDRPQVPPLAGNSRPSRPQGRDVLTRSSINVFFFLDLISFSLLTALERSGCLSEYTSLQGLFAFVYFERP